MDSDEQKFKVFMAEIAANSLKRGESKEQYKERLSNLRDVLDSYIDAALY